MELRKIVSYKEKKEGPIAERLRNSKRENEEERERERKTEFSHPPIDAKIIMGKHFQGRSQLCFLFCVYVYFSGRERCCGLINDSR